MSFFFLGRGLSFQGLHLLVQAYRKMPLKIHVMYSGNKVIYCIFKTYCIRSVLLVTKFCLFHNFMFLFPNKAIFINHVLKFKYQPGRVKVKYVGDFSINIIA